MSPPTVASVVVTAATATLVSLEQTTQLTASASDEDGNPISGKTFSWSSSDDDIATVSSSGLVTAKANGPVTISAEADGVSGSVDMQVEQETAALAYAVEPAKPLAGMAIAPGIEVELRDAGGHLVSTGVDEVTLEIETGKPGALLTGTTTVAAVDGKVTFVDLAIDLAGRGYTLAASSGDISEATSRPFDVLSGLPATAVRAVEPGVTVDGLGATRDLEFDASDMNGDPTVPAVITWTTLNADIATVQSVNSTTGRVTTHREGQVTIVGDAGGLTEHVLVTVSIPDPPDPVIWDWDAFNSNPFHDIWATGPGDIWIVGWSGSVLHYNGTELADVTPKLTTHDLFGVWASGPSDVWAVGRDRAMLHFDGAQWTAVADPNLPHVMEDIWGSGADDVWVAGRTAFGEAALVHFDGTDWTDVTGALPGQPGGLVSLWGSGPSDVWVGASGGGVFRFDGADWSEAGPPVQTEVRDVFGSGASDVWVLEDRTVWHYDGNQWNDRTSGLTLFDRLERGWTSGPGTAWIVQINSGHAWHHNGAQWSSVDVPWQINGAEVITGTGPGDVWAATFWGEIARYNGVGWTNVTPRGSTNTPRAIWGNGPGDIWAVGDGGVILHFDGVSWSEVVEPGNGPGYLIDVWGSDSEHVWAVGTGGGVVRYDGSSWNNVPHGLTFADLKSVWGSAPTDVWVVGDAGTILRFNGAQWETVATAFPGATFGGVWGSSAADVWVAGSNSGAGLLLHYNGDEWTDRTPPGPVLALNDVWGTGPTDLWVVGGGDMILHFDGTDWLNQAPGQSFHFQRVWGTGPKDVWAMGDVNGCCPRWSVGLFHYDGTGWTDRTPGTLTWKRLLGIWGTRSGPLWVLGEHGTRLIGNR